MDNKENSKENLDNEDFEALKIASPLRDVRRTRIKSTGRPPSQFFIKEILQKTLEDEDSDTSSEGSKILSTQTNSNDVTMDIPEWKKMALQKKDGVVDESNSKTHINSEPPPWLLELRNRKAHHAIIKEDEVTEAVEVVAKSTAKEESSLSRKNSTTKSATKLSLMEDTSLLSRESALKATKGATITSKPEESSISSKLTKSTTSAGNMERNSLSRNESVSKATKIATKVSPMDDSSLSSKDSVFKATKGAAITSKLEESSISSNLTKTTTTSGILEGSFISRNESVSKATKNATKASPMEESSLPSKATNGATIANKVEESSLLSKVTKTATTAGIMEGSSLSRNESVSKATKNATKVSPLEESSLSSKASAFKATKSASTTEESSISSRVTKTTTTAGTMERSFLSRNDSVSKATKTATKASPVEDIFLSSKENVVKATKSASKVSTTEESSSSSKDDTSKANEVETNKALFKFSNKSKLKEVTEAKQDKKDDVKLIIDNTAKQNQTKLDDKEVVAATKNTRANFAPKELKADSEKVVTKQEVKWIQNAGTGEERTNNNENQVIKPPDELQESKLKVESAEKHEVDFEKIVITQELPNDQKLGRSVSDNRKNNKERILKPSVDSQVGFSAEQVMNNVNKFERSYNERIDKIKRDLDGVKGEINALCQDFKVFVKLMQKDMLVVEAKN